MQFIDHKQQQLDAKTHQIAGDTHQRHDKPREIDLTEHASVGHKGV